MNAKEMRQKALRQAKKKVSEEKFRTDHLVVHAVQAIDELDAVANLLNERVRNWYALHYPELEKLVKTPETYLSIIVGLKARKHMTEEKLAGFTSKTKNIAMIAKDSMGADLDDRDISEIAKFSELAIHVRKERDELAEYIEDSVQQLAPNTYSICGGMLAGRLIAAAGSLQKLAEFPASTVQVLGAEKALFSHLKKGTLPPKHGLIFQYPAVRQAKRKQRGRMARLVAAKISIASRMDLFQHGLDESLKTALEKKIAAVK